MAKIAKRAQAPYKPIDTQIVIFSIVIDMATTERNEVMGLMSKDRVISRTLEAKASDCVATMNTFENVE